MAIKDLITRHLPAGNQGESTPFLRLQQEMNRMFDRFFDDFRPASFPERFSPSFPQVDVKESRKDVQITAELPGMDGKDIDIRISGDVLTLKGEKKKEQEEKDEHFYRMERSYGAFQRAIPLPCEVESEGIDATFKNGILKIKLLKKPEAQQKSKRIEIKGA